MKETVKKDLSENNRKIVESLGYKKLRQGK